MIQHLPILIVATKSWQLAKQAFSNESSNYRKRQQWKSLFHAVLNYKLANLWFNTLQSETFKTILPHRSRLYLKPFRVYMSTRWSTKQKIKVITDTYQFILSQGAHFAQACLQNSYTTIARIPLGDELCGLLILGYDNRFRKEGELVLSLYADELGGRIVSAAFAFEQTENGLICRIGCIQGHKNEADNALKTVQKALQGLRPKALMVFAVQIFAKQLGAIAMYGSGDAIQAYRRKHFIHLPWRHAIRFDYNSIWEECGGIPSKHGWYELPLIPVKKTMADIKTNKRALYQRRYALLDDAAQQIKTTLLELAPNSKFYNNLLF